MLARLPAALRPRRALVATSMVSLVGVLALLTSSSTCGSFGCECAPCGAAIDLAVFDVDGNALDDGWTVEATVDGFAVDDVTTNCDPAFRFAGNACSFGDRTGIYRITLRGPDIVTREIAARAAAKSGDDCCANCINATSVSAFLEAAPAAEEE
jgi:hypothetical protein